MRILLLSNEYPFGDRPRIGGGGSHVFYLAWGLLEAGHHVSLITHSDARKEGCPLEDYHNFSLLPCIGARGAEDSSSGETALEFCRTMVPDIIHGHHFDGGNLGLTLASSFSHPMVLTMHKPPKPSSDAYSVSDPRYMRRFDYAAWRRLATDTRIGGHVAYSKAYYQENRDIGVPEGKIKLIYHGVPISSLHERVTAKLGTKRLALPRDAIIVVCPLRPEKAGVRTFIEAARILRDRCRDHRFLFIVTGSPKIGTNEARQAARRHVHEARELGLTEDDIWFRTYTLRQMWYILYSSRVCVIPSEREGLSISALEAMALGTPLVASDVVGLNEVIIDGVTGLLATQGKPDEFASRIAKIVSSDYLRTRLISEARARVGKEFSSARMVNEHISLYRKVVEEFI